MHSVPFRRASLVRLSCLSSGRGRVGRRALPLPPPCALARVRRRASGGRASIRSDPDIPIDNRCSEIEVRKNIKDRAAPCFPGISHVANFTRPWFRVDDSGPPSHYPKSMSAHLFPTLTVPRFRPCDLSMKMPPPISVGFRAVTFRALSLCSRFVQTQNAVSPLAFYRFHIFNFQFFQNYILKYIFA